MVFGFSTGTGQGAEGTHTLHQASPCGDRMVSASTAGIGHPASTDGLPVLLLTLKHPAWDVPGLTGLLSSRLEPARA